MDRFQRNHDNWEVVENDDGQNIDSRDEQRNQRKEERTMQYNQSFSVLAPNEKKRAHLLQQRERNMQLYEEAKAVNRKQYQTESPSKVGGPRLTKAQLFEKRMEEQKQSNMLERRKSHERQLKRELWLEEKRKQEDKEINERKRNARIQAERNEEKQRQKENERKKKFDEERRRRYEMHYAGASTNEAFKKLSVKETKTTQQPLKMTGAYDRYCGGRCDREERFTSSQAALDNMEDRDNDYFQVEHGCPYDYGTRSSDTHDEESMSSSEEHDIIRLCRIFPGIQEDLIRDVYYQTGKSFSNSSSIFSTY